MKKILVIFVLVCCANNNYGQNDIVYNDSIFIINKINKDTTITYFLNFNQKSEFNNADITLVKISSHKLEYQIKKNYWGEWNGIFIFKVHLNKNESNFNSFVELTFTNNKKKMIYIFYNPENKIILGKLSHNFCRIKKGETVEHTFRLKNISKDTITILNNEIEDNVLSKFSKSPILPNQSFDFTILFRTEAKDGFCRNINKINFSNGLSINCEYEAYVYFDEYKYPIIEPLFQFDSMVSGMRTYDFGDIKEGSQVKFDYIFKNTSTDTLYIVNISTSCGCHVCSWPRDPILPNQYFKVTNNFNASGKSGSQSKNANMDITNKKGYFGRINFELTAFVVEQCKQESIYFYPEPIRNQ